MTQAFDDGSVQMCMFTVPASSATETVAIEPTPGQVIFSVYGQPSPKGSLRHMGKGRLVEQLAGSKPWREAVKWAAVAARPSAALPGPLRVEVMITVAKPKSAPKRRRTWPITRSSGDIDKHARNVLDALVDANLILDDSQIIELMISKTFASEGPDTLGQPGAVILVRMIGEEIND